MNKNEMITVLMYISQTYGSGKFGYPSGNEEMDKAKARVWYDLLGKLPAKDVMTAIKKYITSGAEWPPNPGQILKLTQKSAISAQEAFKLAIDAVSKFGIYAPEKAKQALSAPIWTTIEHIGGYQMLCMSQEGDTFLMNRFVQVYNLVAEKEQIREIMDRIESPNSELLEGGN